MVGLPQEGIRIELSALGAVGWSALAAGNPID